MRDGDKQHFLILAIIAIALLLLSPLAFSQSLNLDNESAIADLIPASLGVRSDGAGNNWNLESNGNIGRIGSSMVNSGLVLTVNDEKFDSFQPMMTKDGKEFVFQGKELESSPGLRVQRRIRLLNDSGGLRYVELFYNGSANPQVVNVGLETNFSGNYKTFVTNRGRSEPVLLKQAEGGIVVMPGSSQSARAFLFTLSHLDSPIKPSITAQNRYGLAFRYQLQILPGETKAIVHAVGQVVIPQSFERRTMLSLFRPLSFSEMKKGFSPDWANLVVNDGEKGRSRYGFLSGTGVESLKVAPGAMDILAIGDETRLLGTAKYSELRAKSQYGEAEFGIDRIAAIEGKNGKPDKLPKLFLRDGQVISAELEVEEFVFAQLDGGRLELGVDSLDRLVFSENESQNTFPEGALGILETYHGDRLLLSGDNEVFLNGVTPWGNLAVPLRELAWLGPDPRGSLAYQIERSDGTRCLVYLADPKISVTTSDFGDYAISTAETRSIQTPLTRDSETEPNAPIDAAEFILTGDQRILGNIGNSNIPMFINGVVVETPVDSIRLIEKSDSDIVSAGGFPEESPTFRVEKRDGGVISGHLAIDMISLQVGGENWRVPIRDIQSIKTPSPDVNEEFLTTVRGLISELGSVDWRTREKATRELGAFGYLVVPVLKRELQTAGDPEVTRRIRRILSDHN